MFLLVSVTSIACLNVSLLLYSQAARRNPSLPVKLLGYKPLTESTATNPQSNSESLPDLKWTTPYSPSRQAVAHRVKLATSDLAFCHSVSDPALVRASTGRTLKTNDIMSKAMAPTSPLIERLRADGLNSSASDCSDQSGWVSSTVSSRQNSPPPTRHQCQDEPTYPELDPAPLAPPEEFQVRIISVFLRVVTGLSSSFQLDISCLVDSSLFEPCVVNVGSSPVEKFFRQTIQPELDAHLSQTRCSA